MISRCFKKKGQQQQGSNKHRTFKHTEHLQSTEHISRQLGSNLFIKIKKMYFDLCLKISGTHDHDIQFKRQSCFYSVVNWYISDILNGSSSLAIRGVMRGGKGDTILRAPYHWGVPKSPNNVASTFFNTTHLYRKYLKFEHWRAPKLFLLRAPSNLVTPYGVCWSANLIERFWCNFNFDCSLLLHHSGTRGVTMGTRSHNPRAPNHYRGRRWVPTMSQVQYFLQQYICFRKTIGTCFLPRARSDLATLLLAIC